MIMSSAVRRRLAQILGPVFAAALVAYFAYYTVEGERGLLALTRQQAEASREEADLAALKARRESLQSKVLSLRPGSIDLDRLDECTRELLNDSRPDELIIELPKSDTQKNCSD
jgi:cell division protein FtsB